MFNFYVQIIGAYDAEKIQELWPPSYGKAWNIFCNLTLLVIILSVVHWVIEKIIKCLV